MGILQSRGFHLSSDLQESSWNLHLIVSLQGALIHEKSNTLDMSHLILLLTFVISLAKVHGQDVPDYGLFLQDEPIFQDPEISNGELVYDDSTDLFTDDLAANPSNNCLSYDDVDNVFLSDVARIRPRREKCANPDAPQLTPPTNIYDSNGMLNLLSPPAKSPVISGPEKDPNYQDLERLFGLQLPGPTQKDPNTDCPADLYRDSRIPVCQLGSFQRDVELLLGDIYATVYDVRIGKFSPSSFLTIKLTFTASSLADCVNVASAWCCAIVRSAVS